MKDKYTFTAFVVILPRAPPQTNQRLSPIICPGRSVSDFTHCPLSLETLKSWTEADTWWTPSPPSPLFLLQLAILPWPVRLRRHDAIIFGKKRKGSDLTVMCRINFQPFPLWVCEHSKWGRCHRVPRVFPDDCLWFLLGFLIGINFLLWLGRNRACSLKCRDTLTIG